MNLPPRRYDGPYLPPDAGASTLGAYTLRNEWVLWLLKHDPSLLATSPQELYKTDIGERPQCIGRADVLNPETGRWNYVKPRDRCQHPMLARPGAWVCYWHREPVRDPMRLQLKPLRLYDDDDEPIHDVLSLIGDDVDIEYRERKWRVVERKPA